MRLVIVAALLLTGCTPKPERPSWVDKETWEKTIDFKLTFLFENEGCRLWRFRDDEIGYAVYSDCRGAVNWEERRYVGKTIRIEKKAVPTVGSKEQVKK